MSTLSQSEKIMRERHTCDFMLMPCHVPYLPARVVLPACVMYYYM